MLNRTSNHIDKAMDFLVIEESFKPIMTSEKSESMIDSMISDTISKLKMSGNDKRGVINISKFYAKNPEEAEEVGYDSEVFIDHLPKLIDVINILDDDIFVKAELSEEEYTEDEDSQYDVDLLCPSCDQVQIEDFIFPEYDGIIDLNTLECPNCQYRISLEDLDLTDEEKELYDTIQDITIENEEEENE